VELYIQNYGGQKQNVGETINTMIELMTNNYPDVIDNFSISDQDNLLLSFYFEDSIDVKLFETVVTKKLSDLIIEGEISDTFAMYIKQLTFSDVSYNDAIEKLNSYKTNSKYEKTVLDVYTAVLIASNDLWNGEIVTETHQGLFRKCSNWSYFVDAVAGALSAELSPGAYFVAGAASMLVNNVCP